jgi:hypothetical protein
VSTTVRSVALATILAAVCVSRGATAEECPAPPHGPALATVDSQVRIDFLKRSFDREIHDVDEWSSIWGTVYAGGAVLQGVGRFETNDPGKHIDLTVGALSTAFGAVTLYTLPLQITVPLRRARLHLSDPDTCRALARAESTLVSAESDQALGTGIFAHLGNVAVNIGIALILGLGYGRWPSAALSAGVGIAVGEANAFTQPHHLRDVLERYRSARFDGPDVPPLSVSWAVVPVVTQGSVGVGAIVSW